MTLLSSRIFFMLEKADYELLLEILRFLNLEKAIIAIGNKKF